VTDRRRTDEALAERSRLSTLQAHVSTSLTQGGDLGGLLQRCCEGILVNLEAVLVRIWTVDEDGRTLRVRGAAGAKDKLPTTASMNGDSLVARVARHLRLDVTERGPAIADPMTRAWWKRKGLSSYVGHRLMLERRLVGVLEVYSQRALDDLSQQTLETLSRSIALGIERHRAEARLGSALRQLEHTMETMPDAVFTLDAHGRLVQWNQKLERVTGLTRTRLQGRAIRDLVPESEAATVDEKFSLAWAGGGVEWEGHLRRADGSWAPISWSLAGGHVGPEGVRGVTGAGRDISERREGEMRLAQLSRHLLHLREEEQRRISRELHDSTAQNLAALCMSLTALEKTKTRLDEPSRTILDETTELANRCLREVRTISYLLHPPLLDEVGVPAALRWYAKGFAKRSGVKTRVRLPQALGRLEPQLETSIFRIVQESLSNVHRHARAGAVSVELRKKKDSILLEIADDGHGIAALRQGPPASSGSGEKRSADGRPPAREVFENEWMGLGLTGLRERVQEHSGRMEITSGTGGTTLRVELPITRGTAP
jgi:PAS domain S-box-containing protein